MKRVKRLLSLGLSAFMVGQSMTAPLFAEEISPPEAEIDQDEQSDHFHEVEERAAPELEKDQHNQESILFEDSDQTSAVYANGSTEGTLIDGMVFFGTAAYVDHQIVELTPLEYNKAGSIWRPEPYKVNDGLEVTFDYWIGNEENPEKEGADGIILNLSPRQGVGATGGNMGFVGNGSYGVEFDSYWGNRGDPKGQHFGIVKDEVSNHLVTVLDKRVDDETWHSVKVIYSNNVLYLSVDGEETISKDGIELPEDTYIGISSATGNSRSRHLVRNLIVNQTPLTNILATPVLSGVDSGSRTTHLKWEYPGEISDVTKFALYRADSDADFHLVKEFDNQTFEYDDRIIVNGKSKDCVYKIVAYDHYGMTKSSDPVSVTVTSNDEEAPAASMTLSSLGYIGIHETLYCSAEESADNDEIVSYHWDFGDGQTADGPLSEHSYSEPGNYTVKLIVTDASGNTSSCEKLIRAVNPEEENSEYTKIELSVVDAASKKAVSDVTFELTGSNGEVLSLVSDENGKLSCIVPNGDYTGSVLKDDYMARTVTIHAEGGLYQKELGISKTSIMTGDISVTEMTYEEILDAGIDPNAEGNQHVYKFKSELIFTAGFKEYKLDYFVIKNEKDEVIGTSESGYHHLDEPDEKDAPGGHYSVGVFPVSENFVLVIYGEAHWLKEMYQVDLIINNNSNTDTLENIKAELILPDGLSLADKTNGRKQTAEQTLDSIGYSESGKLKWYIRGDKEGDYNLTAKVEAVSMPFEEIIQQKYTTANPVHVYAGSALNLKIIAEDVAYRGQEYTVKYRLENVSDRPIYNLVFGLTGMEQFKVLGMGTDQETWKTITDCDYGDAFTRRINNIAPGGYIELELATTIWFNSSLELIEFTEMGSFLDVAYYLTDITTTTLEGSTTEIPVEYEIVQSERSSYIERIIKEALKGKFSEIDFPIPKGSLGGNIIELIGDQMEIPLPLIKGAKTLLSLQQGQTISRMKITIDDGYCTENSIYNDEVTITAGNTAQVITDMLNGTSLTVDSGEISIEFKGTGATKVKVGIINDYGETEREFVFDVVTEDREIKESLTVSPDGISNSYTNGNEEWNTSVQLLRDKQKEELSENPFVIFPSTLQVELSHSDSGTDYDFNMTTEQLDQLLAGTATTNVEINKNGMVLNFDEKALETINGGSGNLTFRTKNLSEEDGRQGNTYQFSVENGDRKISDFNGGEVKVTIPYVTDNPDQVVVEHLKDDGTVEILETEYDAENHRLSFVTGSFSTFTIREEGVHVHVFGEPVFTWSEDLKEVSAAMTCSECEEVLEKECSVEAAVTDPTCVDAGETVYTASFVHEDKTYTDEKKIETEQLGHEWAFETSNEAEHQMICTRCSESQTEEHHFRLKENPEFIWSEDYSSAYVETECGDCHQIVRNDCEVSSQTIGSDCTEPGEIIYTASLVFDGQTFTDEKKIISEAIGHEYVYTSIDEKTHKKECVRCGEKETEDHQPDSTFEPVFVWSEDGSSAHTETRCKDCQAITANECMIQSETVDPTCTDAGETVVTASFDFEGKTYTDEKKTVIPATGHEYVYSSLDSRQHRKECTRCSDSAIEDHRTLPVENPEFIWSEDYSSAHVDLKCEDCAENIQKECTVTVESAGADCTQAGEIVYTATLISGDQTFTDVKKAEVEAIGHDFIYISINGHSHRKECTRCSETQEEEHEMDPSADPVFVWSDDLTEASAETECRTCHEKMIIECEVHSETTDPTCTENGETVYSASFEKDGSVFTDRKAVVLPALGHEYSYTSADEITHKKECSRCQESSTEDHRMDESAQPKFIWSDDFSSAYAETECPDCHATVKHECEIRSEGIGADCSKSGEMIYTAVFVSGEQEFTDEKRTEVQAIGHDYVIVSADEDTHRKECSRCHDAVTESHQFVQSDKPEIIWSDDFSKADAVLECSECGKKVEKECSVSRETSDATCTAQGRTVYTATVTVNDQTFTDTREEVQPALGHDYVYESVDSQNHKKQCSRCSDSVTEKHSFKDGKCQCGQKDSSDEKPENQSGLKKVLNKLVSLIRRIFG